MIEKNAKIYVAGHRGLVGSAIVRSLKKDGYTNIVKRTHSELDLTNQAAVFEFFEKERPEYVVLAAAHVGGINANLDRAGKIMKGIWRRMITNKLIMVLIILFLLF